MNLEALFSRSQEVLSHQMGLMPPRFIDDLHYNLSKQNPTDFDPILALFFGVGALIIARSVSNSGDEK